MSPVSFPTTSARLSRSCEQSKVGGRARKRALSQPRHYASHHMTGLRVGTWNVEGANVLANDRRLEILRIANADVWVLTETRDELNLGPEYNALSSSLRDPTVGPPPRWVTVWA